MTFDDKGLEVTIDRDFIKVADRNRGTSVEYRGQVPGGLACSGYAEQILRARAREAMTTGRRCG